MVEVSIRSRFEGAMFGLAAGDAFGAPHEGGPIERLVWRVIGKTRDGKRRWTDDTQMSLNIAESLIENRNINQDDLANRFASSYRWSRGYGPGAAKVLKRIKRGVHWKTACRSVFPDGSYGNGAAMRAPLIGVYFHSQLDQIDHASRRVAEITHAHPLAIEGARLIAHVAATACQGRNPKQIWSHLLSLKCEPPFSTKLELAINLAESGQQISAANIRKQLGNGIAAQNSVVTAIFIGLTNYSNTFHDLLKLAISLGGDTDTIAAMAGSIWGALHGIENLPVEFQTDLENEEMIRKTVRDLHASASKT